MRTSWQAINSELTALRAFKAEVVARGLANDAGLFPEQRAHDESAMDDEARIVRRALMLQHPLEHEGYRTQYGTITPSSERYDTAP